MQGTYHRNIYNLYLIKISKWLMLVMPVVALFYNENGLDEFDIYLLQAIYSLSVAIMEIPSGYLADMVGRKKTLVLGSILGTLGFVIYSLSYNFLGFLVAEITLGIGGSFISGADSAMLFDSLAAMRKKHLYLQFEGRLTSLGGFAETAAAVCGGMIAGFLSYRAVYVSQALIAALAIPASLLLVEPPREAKIALPGLRHILTVCRCSLFLDAKLASTIFLSATIGIATLCMAWSVQIYFVTRGFTEVTITPLWVSLNLTVAIVAACAAQTQKLLGKRRCLQLIVIYMPATYILLGILPLPGALAGLYLFYAIRGYATPLLKDLVNQNCDSTVRATVLSIRNLLIRLGFACLGPAIGVISVASSLSFGFIMAGLVLFVASLATARRLFRHLPECSQNAL